MSSPTGIHPRSRPITALRKPSGATLVIAALVSAALLIFSGVAVWRHMGGSSGDPVDERGAVITRVGGAVDAASTHAATCSAGLTSLASAAIDQSTDTNMAEFESCGKTARALAEMGYTALDGGTDLSDSPLRAAYLDAAGSLLSVYEMQGDDFDVIYDLLHRARSGGASSISQTSDITYILGNVAPDIAANQQELDRARAAYRKRG